ncbi:hypothetical protein JCM10213_000204 [Rhodosporidiobolus nylandii]
MADPHASTNSGSGALHALLAKIAQVGSSGGEKGAGDDGGVREVCTALEGWLKKLEEQIPPDVKTLIAFARFLRTSTVDCTPSATAVRRALAFEALDPAAEEGEAENQDEEDGRRLKALLETLSGLVIWAQEECVALKEEKSGAGRERRKAWEEVLVGVLEGLKGHLSAHPFEGDKPNEDEKLYRTLLMTVLLPALHTVFLPAPSILPSPASASKQDSDELMDDGVPPLAKYLALDVLNELLSKLEANKKKMRAVVKVEHLGRLLALAQDPHLSYHVLEAAYRLTPGRPRPVSSHKPSSSSAKKHDEQATERQGFIDRLFDEKNFGAACGRLRKMYEGITARNWEEQTPVLLHQISDMGIKRSQLFRPVSVLYNSEQLLVRPEGEDSPPHGGAPSLAELEAETAYERREFWIGRHILGSMLPPLADDDEGEGDVRTTVSLEGVERVFVEDLEDQGYNLLRVTFLLSRPFPLTLDNKPHPSSPQHVGRDIASAKESQASDALPKMHRLEMLITGKGDNLGVLKKTLTERMKRYPNLGRNLATFPLRLDPRAAPATALPAASPSSRSAAKPHSKTSQPDAPDVVTDGGGRDAVMPTAEGSGAKSVAFAPSPSGRPSREKEAENEEQGKGKQKEGEEKGDVGPAPLPAQEKPPNGPLPSSAASTGEPSKASQPIGVIEQVFPVPLPPAVSGAGSSSADAQSAAHRSDRHETDSQARANKVAELAKLSPMGKKQGAQAGEKMDLGHDADFDFQQQEYGGGFDDAEQQASSSAAGAAQDSIEDDLPRPSQVALSAPARNAEGQPVSRRTTLPTSDDGHPAAATKGDMKKTPAAPASRAAEKKDGRPAQVGRPRSDTVGKPRPSQEEDVTPSGRALQRRESQQATSGAVEKVKPAAAATSKTVVGGRQDRCPGTKAAQKKQEHEEEDSDLSDLSSEDEAADGADKAARFVPPKPAPAAKSVAPPAAKGAKKDKKRVVSTGRGEDAGQKRRRSPRLSSPLSGSGGSENEVVVSVKPAATKPAAKKAKVVKPASPEPADEEEQSTTTSRPHRAAARKVVAAAPKAKKRERDEASEEDEESSEDEGEEDDYAAPAPASKKGKAAAKTKKVVAPKGKGKKAAEPSRPSKRRKVDPSPSPSPSLARAADSDDDGEVTDYDTYPSPKIGSTLEEKKGSMSPAHRYGRERKAPKPGGGKKKAGQRKSAATTASEAEGAKTGKGRKPAAAGKAKKRDAETPATEEEESTMRGGRTTRSQAKKKVVKRAAEESDSGMEDIENVRPKSVKKDPHDKRVSDDIPPPFDLTSPRKSPTRRSPEKEDAVTKGGSGGTSPRREKSIRSFSQLVATPPAEHELEQREDEPAPGEVDLGAAIETLELLEKQQQESLEYGGGFDQPVFDDQPIDDAFAPRAFDTLLVAGGAADAAPEPAASHTEQYQQQHRLSSSLEGRVSYSSFLVDPAKDFTFVDRAVPSARTSGEKQQGQQLEPAATVQSQLLVKTVLPTDAPARQALPAAAQAAAQKKYEPKVLVEDTQSSVERSPRPPAAPVAVDEGGDVLMRDASGVSGEGKAAAEEVDTDDLFSQPGALDDSGSRFEVPMDQGVEGDEEEMASAGAELVVSAADEGSSERASDALSVQPQSAAEGQPVSAPLLASAAVRPLLVEKALRPSQSADAADPGVAQQKRAAPPAPDASISGTHPGRTAATAQPPPPAPAPLPHQIKTLPTAALPPVQHPVRPSRLIAQGGSAYGSESQAGPAPRDAPAQAAARHPPHQTHHAPAPAKQPQQRKAFPVLPDKPQAQQPRAVPPLRSSRSRPSIAAFTAAQAKVADRGKGKAVLPTTAARLAFAPKPHRQQRLPVFSSPPFAALPFQLGKGRSAHRSKGKSPGGGVVFAPAALPTTPGKGKGKHRSSSRSRGEATAMKTDQGGEQQQQQDEWEEDDHEVFALFGDFAEYMTERHRERKQAGQAHYEASVAKVDRQLVKHAKSVHDDSRAIVAGAADVVAAAAASSAPDSRFLQLLTRARDINAHLWREAETELVAMRKAGEGGT